MARVKPSENAAKRNDTKKDMKLGMMPFGIGGISGGMGSAARAAAGVPALDAIAAENAARAAKAAPLAERWIESGKMVIDSPTGSFHWVGGVPKQWAKMAPKVMNAVQRAALEYAKATGKLGLLP